MKDGKTFQPFWEVDPAEGAELDFQLFEGFIDRRLPIIDFGCGTGIQSKWLATKFEKVIGIDVSSSVIEIARSRSEAKNIEYLVADITNLDQALNIHETYGPCNVYIRGVLHQIKLEDRKKVAQSLLKLIGNTGSIFIYEVADNIRSYIRDHESNFRTWPKIMQRVFLGKLPPHGMSEESIQSLFDPSKFEIAFCDKTFLKTKLKFGDGDQVNVPCVRAIVKSR